MADCCEWTGTALLRPGTLAPQGLPTFENIAALVAFRVSTPQDGMLTWVRSVQDVFEYQADSALTDDGITIVTPVSTVGRWVRLKLPNEKWARQTEWHIDASAGGAGNDENDGATDATPLKSHAELERRISRMTITANTVIVIHSDLAEEVHLDVSIAGATGSVLSLTYAGVPLFGQDLATGTITATAAVPSTNTPATITDSNMTAGWSAGGPSGSSLIGQRVKVVGGDQDSAIAWIVKQEATLTVARTSVFTKLVGEADTEVVPPANSQYVIERLPRVLSLDLQVRQPFNSGVCVVTNIAVEGAGVASTVMLRGENGDNQYTVRNCQLSTERICGHRARFRGCMFRGPNGFLYPTGEIEVFAGATTSSIIVLGDSAAELNGNHLVQITEAFRAGVQTGGGSVVTIGDLAIFDGSKGIVVADGTLIRVVGALWGALSAGVGIAISVLGVVARAQSAPTPTLTPGSGDFEVSVAGEIRAYVDEFFNTNNGAAYVIVTAIL